MFSFAKSKQVVDVYPYVRRLCDLSAPNLAVSERRSEDRHIRAIPALLVPWKDGRPLVNNSVIGLTSDIADRGVGLILHEPFRAESVVVGYWAASDDMLEPWYFLGSICHEQALGGGYRSVGVEFAEFANADYTDELLPLRPLAAKLLPPAEATVE